MVLGKIRSQFSHVTEVTSDIDGIISFLMMVHDTPVNTGNFKIRELRGRGKIVNVNTHHATDCSLSIRDLEVGVLVNGQLVMSLYPRDLISHSRITFHSRVDAGKTIFFATGLNTKEEDQYLRIRFRTQKRREVYEKRENDPELVTFLGEGVLEENESGQRSDNNTSEEVATPADDCFIDDGLSSHGRANQNTAALSLAYEKPSFVKGTGEIAVIPTTAINKKMVEMMKHALVGFLCVDEIPNCAAIKDFLTDTLGKFRECKVLFHGNGFFSFVFSSEEYRTKVLEHRQLFIKGKPLILKKWTQDLAHEPRLFLYSLPVWVRIYNLNLAYWSIESFAIISKEIGSLLFLDKATTSIIEDPRSFNYASTSTQCIYFAKVCIEINPRDVLPADVSVSINGKSISVGIEYEWRPQLCMHCCLQYPDTSSSNTASEDAFSQREDQHVIITDHEMPEQILGNTRLPSHCGLITEDDEVDGSVGESACEPIAFSFPESWNEKPGSENQEVRRLIMPVSL